MRGDIIHFEPASGQGLISGEDGQRYSFDRYSMLGQAEPFVGARVDFVAMGAQAREIALLVAYRAGGVVSEDLSLWDYFVRCMRMYFNGNGRARRKEYWSFILFKMLFMFAILVVGGVLLAAAAANAQSYDSSADDALGVVWWIVTFIVGLPFLAPHWSVLARRLHDVGMSGWLALIWLVPFVGDLFVFIISVLPSQEGANEYGPQPRSSRGY